MKTLAASVPCGTPPVWAVLERQLFTSLNASIAPFVKKYMHDDGTLIWRDTFPGRDGADDFYESCYNWPLLYLLGGADELLPLVIRAWDAITRQLTQLGHVVDDYERGYDWFHQGEGNLFFYFLCMADPQRPEHVERALRFAELYLGDNPVAANYDPVRAIIRAPHNGSGGPRWGFTDGEPSYRWSASMERYGLPYEDVPGVGSYDDLKDPALARRMGEAMQTRMGSGDVVANLAATSLATNAYLMTGDERYRRWVLSYVDAWMERASANDGLLPDNVDLKGKIGGNIAGKWYGGLYGWTWPHGFYNIGMAALIAASNAWLLSRDARYLTLARTQIDHIVTLGHHRDPRELPMSLREHWIGQFAALGDVRALFVVPHRHGDSGWFDEQPLAPAYPVGLWNVSQDPGDWKAIERFWSTCGYDADLVVPFRNKEDAGHEAAWTRFLTGKNPSYPEEILRESLGQVMWRLDQIRADTTDLTQNHIHHWQELNPVLTEALVQLTLGAPQVVYNGGLLFASLRYFDAVRQRPGLPDDVAALVTSVAQQEVVVELVNLSPTEEREVILQAGSFGEHHFTTVSHLARRDANSYPGKPGLYAWPEATTERRTDAVNGPQLRVILPAGTRFQATLRLERNVHMPSYTMPWSA
jgi:hypothetical protein